MYGNILVVMPKYELHTPPPPSRPLAFRGKTCQKKKPRSIAMIHRPYTLIQCRDGSSVQIQVTHTKRPQNGNQPSTVWFLRAFRVSTQLSFCFLSPWLFPNCIPELGFQRRWKSTRRTANISQETRFIKKKKLKTTMPHVTLWRMQRICRMWRMLMFFNAFLFLLLRFQEQWRILAVEHVIVYV